MRMSRRSFLRFVAGLGANYAIAHEILDKAEVAMQKSLFRSAAPVQLAAGLDVTEVVLMDAQGVVLCRLAERDGHMCGVVEATGRIHRASFEMAFGAVFSSDVGEAGDGLSERGLLMLSSQNVSVGSQVRLNDLQVILS